MKFRLDQCRGGRAYARDTVEKRRDSKELSARAELARIVIVEEKEASPLSRFLGRVPRVARLGVGGIFSPRVFRSLVAGIVDDPFE